MVVSTVGTFVLFEAAYRYHCYRRAPSHFLQEASEPKSFGFQNRSTWDFDQDIGFKYGRHSPLVVGEIRGGQLVGCTEIGPYDFGGMGTKTNWAEGTEFKVLVLGDSFTATAHKGRTWTDYLRDELQSKSPKKVDVINLALDGIGILQFLDIAARKVPELRPDLVIFAFITDDLTRARIWRTTAEVDGRLRVFTTRQPKKDPDLRDAVDTTLISPDVTMQWCTKSPTPNRANDQVVRDLELRYRLAVELAENRLDLYGLDRSLLVDRIRYGTPFRHLVEPSKKSTNPRHELMRFSADDRAKEAARVVRESGSTVMLFHLATRSELRQQQEYLFRDEARERSLIDSLEDLMGSKVHGTRQHLTFQLDKLDAMGVSDNDDHPAEYGMLVYSKVVTEAIRFHRADTAGETKGGQRP